MRRRRQKQTPGETQGPCESTDLEVKVVRSNSRWQVVGALVPLITLIIILALNWPRLGMSVAEALQNSASPAVTIEAFQFKPRDLEVKAETKVVWTNDDDVLHTVTSGVPERRTDLFNGSLNGKGMKFEFTFTKPGTYAYFCNRHQHMRGEITVK